MSSKHDLWVLLGAECTGKSTLARAWAQANPDWQCVDEYLREFCAAQGRTPRQDEQSHIADEQNRRINAAWQHRPVIADTHPFQTAVYSEVFFRDESLFDAAVHQLRRADRVWVCTPDFEWQADGFQRDGAKVRETVHWRLLNALDRSNISFIDLIGQIGQRLDKLRAHVTRPGNGSSRPD